MGPDLDTLATALYARIDDLLAANPDWAPQRPVVGISPKLSDAELVTLAAVSALLGFDSERRFVRFARAHLRPWFPYVPNHSGYNKRLRRCAAMIDRVIAALARECPDWHDDVWLVDSTPVECGRSRDTAKRSDLAGVAQYGYCRSHSRWFWGLRLHLIATPSGLPIAYALAGAKADEREVCAAMIDRAGLARPGQTLIADKGYRSKDFETRLNEAGITLIRPATRAEPPAPAPGSCGRCARSSSRPTRPSRPSSASNDTAAAPQQASPHAYSPDCSHSPPPSGTTATTTANPHAHSPPTTTNPLEPTI